VALAETRYSARLRAVHLKDVVGNGWGAPSHNPHRSETPTCVESGGGRCGLLDRGVADRAQKSGDSMLVLQMDRPDETMGLWLLAPIAGPLRSAETEQRARGTAGIRPNPAVRTCQMCLSGRSRSGRYGDRNEDRQGDSDIDGNDDGQQRQRDQSFAKRKCRPNQRSHENHGYNEEDGPVHES
jgi:hypothetical protein